MLIKINLMPNGSGNSTIDSIILNIENIVFRIYENTAVVYDGSSFYTITRESLKRIEMILLQNGLLL